MPTVASQDGTAIAYERRGDGPAVVLVTGSLDDGAENAPLAERLAGRFTVYNYARRGRGESGGRESRGRGPSSGGNALDREIEDLHAVVEAAGGSAHLYGVSTGGALIFQAVTAGVPVGRIAVYEVPYLVDDVLAGAWRDYREALATALAEERRDDALTLFMRLAGSSEADIEGARRSPFWPGLRSLAPTLVYDAACLGDGRPPVATLAAVTAPTLVVTGGALDYFELAGDAIAAAVPGARRRTLTGQGHVVDPDTMAAELVEFFT